MTPDSTAPQEPLQFETAVPADAPATPAACVACKQPIHERYYTAGKAVVCASCKSTIEQSAPTKASAALIARAVLFGCGGAILGAVLYYAVLAATGYQIALVAIASAFIVGRAVQIGARGRRGRAFQVVAVVLAYVAIAAGYAPEVLKDIAKNSKTAAHADTAKAISSGDKSPPAVSAAAAKITFTPRQFVGALAVTFAVVLALPLLATFAGLPMSLLTGIIVGVGLRQAWLMNRRAPPPVFEGPFRVGAASQA